MDPNLIFYLPQESTLCTLNNLEKLIHNFDSIYTLIVSIQFNQLFATIVN